MLKEENRNRKVNQYTSQSGDHTVLYGLVLSKGCLWSIVLFHNYFQSEKLEDHADIDVPDQVRTLSQVGTKKISKGAGPFWNFLSHIGTMT